MERAPKTILVLISWHGVSNLVQRTFWSGYFSTVPASNPALFHRVLPCNIGERFMVNLLPSLIAMIIEAFGALSCLENHL